MWYCVCDSHSSDNWYWACMGHGNHFLPLGLLGFQFFLFFYFLFFCFCFCLLHLIKGTYFVCRKMPFYWWSPLQLAKAYLECFRSMLLLQISLLDLYYYTCCMHGSGILNMPLLLDIVCLEIILTLMPGSIIPLGLHCFWVRATKISSHFNGNCELYTVNSHSWLEEWDKFSCSDLFCSSLCITLELTSFISFFFLLKNISSNLKSEKEFCTRR